MSAPIENYFHEEAPILRPPLDSALSIRGEGERRGEQELKEEALKGSTGSFSFLFSTASAIPQSIFSLCENEQIMLFLLQVFSIASKVCSLASEDVAKQAPWLNLFAAPIYLYHSLEGAKRRLGLMLLAFRVQRFSSFLFFTVKTVESINGSILVAGKSFSGAVTLFGMNTMGVFSLLLNMVLPIVSIVAGATSGISQLWNFYRTYHLLDRLSEAKEKEHLGAFIDLLNYLQGSQQKVKKEDRDSKKVANEHFELERQELEDAAFTSQERGEEIQSQIDQLLRSSKLQCVHSYKQAFVSPQMKGLIQKLSSFPSSTSEKETPNISKEVLELLNRLQLLFERVTLEENEGLNVGELIEEMLSFYSSLDAVFEAEEMKGFWEKHSTIKQTLVDLGISQKESLSELKQNFFAGSEEVVALAIVEMRRALLYQLLYLLGASLTIASGTLYFTHPQSQMLMTLLSITGNSLTALQVVFDKGVSQKTFKHMHDFIIQLMSEDFKI